MTRNPTTSLPDTFWRWPLAISLAVLLVDQLTKWFIIRTLRVGDRFHVFYDFFHVVHLRNTGAAWGLFQGYTLALTILSLAVLAVMIRFYQYFVDHYNERAIALGLIVGGILGNLTDRVFRGEVVDFLLFFYRSFQWPAFNVADSAITVGVTIFVLSSFIRANEEKRRNEKQPA